MQTAGYKLSAEEWSGLLSSLSTVFARTLPTELQSKELRAQLQLPLQPPLITPLPHQPGPLQPQHADKELISETVKDGSVKLSFTEADFAAKCKVQLMLMDALYQVVLHFYPNDEHPSQLTTPQSQVTPTTSTSTSTSTASIPCTATITTTATTATEEASPGEKYAEEQDREQQQGSPEAAYEEGLQGEEEGQHIVARARKYSTEKGKTRVYHGPAETITAAVRRCQLQEQHIILLLEALTRSVALARGFNADIGLRQRLLECGFMKQQQKGGPELYYQEAHGLHTYLKLLFKLYSHQTDSSDMVEARMLAMVRFVLNDYAERTQRDMLPVDHEQWLRCMDGVVCSLLDGLQKMRDWQFRRNFPLLFPSVTSLIQCGSPSIRRVVRTLFDAKVLPMFLQ